MVFEATGETGIFPVEGGLVVSFLMMPRPPDLAWGASNLTMHDTNSANDTAQDEDKSHADRVREQMDTKDLGAIMSRFYSAVSWGGTR